MAIATYIGTEPEYKTLGEYAVGSVVQLRENGYFYNYIVIHQGTPNHSLYDESSNGTWLVRAAIFGSTVEYGSANTTVSGVLQRYDSDIQNRIMLARLPSRKSSTSSTAYSVFNLSPLEITPITENSRTPLLDYFNVDDTRVWEGQFADTTRSWERYAGDGSWYINSSGKVVYSARESGSTTNYRVRPTLILPFDTQTHNKRIFGTERMKYLASRVKSAYIGIENYAKPIKRVYIGVENIARPCFDTTATALKWGSLEPLQYATSQCSGASTPNHALFAQYHEDFLEESSVDIIDSYDITLTKNLNVPQNSQIVTYTNGNSFQDYAVFWGNAGGQYKICAYDDNLTLFVDKFIEYRFGVKRDNWSTTIGKYLMITVGDGGSGILERQGAIAFDEYFTGTLAINYSYELYNSSMMASNDNYAFLYETAPDTPAIQYFGYTLIALDKELVKTTFNSSSALPGLGFRNHGTGTSNGDYALFVGGGKTSDTSASSASDFLAIDNNLTSKTSSTGFSTVKGSVGIRLGELATFFGGGIPSSSAGYDIAGAINQQLVVQQLEPLTLKSNGAGIARLRQIVLIAGGSYTTPSTTIHNNVDMYKLTYID